MTRTSLRFGRSGALLVALVTLAVLAARKTAIRALAIVYLLWTKTAFK